MCVMPPCDDFDRGGCMGWQFVRAGDPERRTGEPSLTTVELSQIAFDGRGNEMDELVVARLDDNFSLCNVLEHGNADQLSNYQRCTRLSVWLLDDGDEGCEHLLDEELSQHARRLVIRHGRSDEAHDNVSDLRVVQHEQVTPNNLL